MAVSRILSPASCDPGGRPFILPRPLAKTRHLPEQVRLLPGGLSACANGTGNPFLLFCLAPQGVYHAPGIAPKAGGLLPRLFTLARGVKVKSESERGCPPRHSALSLFPPPGGLFSVTLSVAGELPLQLPRFRRACRLVVSGLSSPVSCDPEAAVRHRRSG